MDWRRLLPLLALLTSLTAHAEPVSYSVWSEFTSYADVLGELPGLCRSGTGLFLAVHDGDWDAPSFTELWREAAACGIPLRAWLLLKPGDGYWVSSRNIAETESIVSRFLEAMDDRGLDVPWITFDLEPSPEFQRDLIAKMKKFAFARILKELRESRSELAPAVARLATLVDSLHERGIRAHAVTMPFVLDDLEAGDTRLEGALGIPFSGVPWDEASFMVYRPEFQRILGKITPRIVYDYALKARRLLGERATIDLGEVGTVGYPDPAPGYLDPRELESDVSAALAAGVSEIHVYSLDGILQQGGTGKWLGPASAKKPRASLGASLLEDLIRLGRKLL
jgi:hypothetical protein